MKRKILRRIKAPAEFEVRSCYYNQLMVAYTKFGADARIIAAGYLPLYGFDHEKVWPMVKGCEIFDEKVLQRLTGVKRAVCTEIGDPIKFIVEQIDEGRLVILPVDCFELSYRPDQPQKHIVHFILIFGYDLEKKVFLAHEHFYFNSMKYQKISLPMDIIISAYESYQKFVRAEDGFSAIVVFKGYNQKTLDFIPEFKKGLARHQKELKISRMEFLASLTLIMEWMTIPKKLKEVQEIVIEAISIYRSNKTYEKNLFHALGIKDAFQIADRIVEDYIFLYGVFVKTKLTGYQARSIEKAFQRLKELERLERDLCHFWEEFYG